MQYGAQLAVQRQKKEYSQLADKVSKSCISSTIQRSLQRNWSRKQFSFVDQTCWSLSIARKFKFWSETDAVHSKKLNFHLSILAFWLFWMTQCAMMLCWRGGDRKTKKSKDLIEWISISESVWSIGMGTFYGLSTSNSWIKQFSGESISQVIPSD